MNDIPTESTQTERSATSSEENLQELENARIKATTVKQTTRAVKLFKGTTSNFTVHNTYQTHPIILYIKQITTCLKTHSSFENINNNTTNFFPHSSLTLPSSKTIVTHFLLTCDTA